MAVAGVGYGLYKGYKWLSSRTAPKELEAFRLLQYGFRKTPKSKLAAIRNFEDSFLKDYYYKGKNPTINDLLDDYAGMFNIDLENIDHKVGWSTWFKERFLPIFLKQIKAMDSLELKHFNEIEKQSDDMKRDYILTSTPDELQKAYEVLTSPFPLSLIHI